MSVRYSRFRSNSVAGSRQSISHDETSDLEIFRDGRSEGAEGRAHSTAALSRQPLASGAHLSVSYNQRPAVRSFSHNTPYMTSDTAQYSYSGVRELTSELASFALADADSLRSGTTPPRHFHAPSSDLASRSGEASSLYLGDDVLEVHRRHSDAHLPNVIEEESSSPEDAGIAASTSHKSALSNLFRTTGRHPSVHDGLATAKQQSTTRRISTASRDEDASSNIATESTPLLTKTLSADHTTHKALSSIVDPESSFEPTRKKPNQFQRLTREATRRMNIVWSVSTTPKKWSAQAVWEQGFKRTASFIPPVFVGLLLNVLDGLSYGMILFPLGEEIFKDTAPDGISMFYISCIVSQLVYSLGGSIFKGAVGSEMIEVVPFFHKMTYTIMAMTGKENPKVVLATVIVSYALSAIVTGLVFFLLGAFKLGSLVNFFPRHILIGCIGGVGFFLFVTGIEVSARLDGNLQYNLETLEQLMRPGTLLLWLPPLGLAALLVLMKRFIRLAREFQYLDGVYFFSVAAMFYIVVAAAPPLNLDMLRDRGFIFPKVAAGVPWYHFYSYYDFSLVNWSAVGRTVPAMFALTFFGILHVPINVPSLGIAVQEDDLNLNRELVAHGISNALSGCAGSIQNYLVYANSKMFIQTGGNSRLAGILLAAATFGVLLAGPDMIGYVPIMVVGALIFFLGIELLLDALYETLGKMKRLEYLNVLAIVLIMGIYDFVYGILAGIILACLNFVVQSSQSSAIRAKYSGEVVQSTVRRHPMQRYFLHEVGGQIYVTKLAGFLFFGSIVQVEKSCRALIEEEAFRSRPIRYLVIDLAHVHAMDYSAAEAFERLERLLARRSVNMIVSGVDKNDAVGKSLRSIGLWHEESSVKFFEDLNSALENCENELLIAFYERRDKQLEAEEAGKHSSLEVPKQGDTPAVLDEVFGSPRQRGLDEAATTTLEEHRGSTKKWKSFKQPLPLILQAFQGLTDKNEDFWFPATAYFIRKEIPQGTVLYSRGDLPEGFYLLEKGILRATYEIPQGQYHESIVAGTTCGELPFFSETARTATVGAEQSCVAWLIDRKSLERLEHEKPEILQELLKVALKLTSERMNAITSYVLTASG